MPKKNKTVILEAKYIGQWTFLTDWGVWRKWKAYHTKEVALTAMEGFQKKYRGYEFRLKPE
jgi:hypothetical protein